jgi:hypothetical protein
MARDLGDARNLILRAAERSYRCFIDAMLAGYGAADALPSSSACTTQHSGREF